MSLFSAYLENSRQCLPALRMVSVCLAALFACLFWKKLPNTPKLKAFYLFGIFAGILCTFPITGALLYLWQVPFYDYSNIWSLFPAAAIWGICISMLLITCYSSNQAKVKSDLTKSSDTHISNNIDCNTEDSNTKDSNAEDSNAKKTNTTTLKWFVPISIVLIILAIFLARSSNNATQATYYSYQETYDKYRDLIAHLDEICDSEQSKPTILALDELSTLLPMTSSDYAVLYGRDIYEPALGGYTFDKYDEQTYQLRAWLYMAACYGKLGYSLEELETNGISFFSQDIKGTDMLTMASEKGVDIIIFPISEQAMGKKAVKKMKKACKKTGFTYSTFQYDEVNKTGYIILIADTL